MTKVIEVVLFKAQAGVELSSIKEAALAIEPIVSTFDGFISRSFAIGEDAQLIDIVHWENMACAQAAMEKAMTVAEFGAFFGLIDESTIKLSHFTKA